MAARARHAAADRPSPSASYLQCSPGYLAPTKLAYTVPHMANSLCAFGAVMLLSAGLSPAQTKAKAENVPDIPYDAVRFLKFPPNLYMGEGIGVATNSKDHIFVYTRSQETRLFEFDAKGNYLREIGEGLYGFAFAHAVRVDPQDNIWAV